MTLTDLEYKMDIFAISADVHLKLLGKQYPN
jgi:hypothetical protein